MSSKGKGKLSIAPGYGEEFTSDGTSITNLLRTPDDFNMDDLGDVDDEIDRLESLAADYHELNNNERFLVRINRLFQHRENLTLFDSLEESINRPSVDEPQSSHTAQTAPGANRQSVSRMLTPEATPTAESAAPKRKRQEGRQQTMTMDPSPSTKRLTEDELLAVATQPPRFRKKYSRYYNRSGRIRPAFYKVIFRRDRDGNLELEPEHLASNVERWEYRLKKFEHPEYYNIKNGIRKRAIKVRADQRDPRGRFTKNEVDEMNESTRTQVVSSALQRESLLGAQEIAPPSPSQRLETAEVKLVHLQASVHERDAFHRAEMLKMDRKIKAKDRKIKDLKEEVKKLLAKLERQEKVIDKLLVDNEDVFFSASSDGSSQTDSSSGTHHSSDTIT